MTLRWLGIAAIVYGDGVGHEKETVMIMARVAKLTTWYLLLPNWISFSEKKNKFIYLVLLLFMEGAHGYTCGSLRTTFEY